MRRLAALAIVCLILAAEASAHAPTTAIGRAVEAFGQMGIKGVAKDVDVSQFAMSDH